MRLAAPPGARWLRALAAAFLVAFFAAESWTGARRDAQTSDESVTIASGYAYLRTGRVRINPEHPMLGKALLALPLLRLGAELDTQTDAWRRGDQWLAAYELLWENRVPPAQLLRAVRLPAIAVSVLLLAVIFFSAGRLYGPDGGLAALALAATCPDLLGHGHLATLDVPLTLASALALLALLAYAERPGRRRHLLLGLALGLVLAVKISGLQVLAALGVAAVVRALLDPVLATRGSVHVPRALARYPRAASLYVLAGGLVVATGLAAVVLVATYLGRPDPYLMGLVQNAWLSGYGHPTWLLGEVSSSGFRSYFLVALALKLPLPVVALALVTAASARLLRLGRRIGRVELTLLAYAVSLLALASFGPAQAGVRYLFPAYPVLFVLIARLLAVPVPSAARRADTAVAAAVFSPLPDAVPLAGSAPARPADTRQRLVLVVVILLSSLGTALMARPLYLSSMNELVFEPEEKLHALADSNLDWGQDLGRLGAWLRARGSPPVRLSLFTNAPPEAYGIAAYQALPAAGPVLPPRPTFLPAGSPDLVAVSGNNLIGLFFDRDLYAWLREREPLAVVGGSIWVYDLGRRAADHRRLARTYREAGWARWAVHEEHLAAGLP